MKRQWRTIMGFVLIFIIVLFSLLNMKEVPIHFGVTTYDLPLVLLILFAAFIGFLIATLSFSSQLMKKNRQIKELEEKLAKPEAELTKQQETFAIEKRKYENEIAQLTAKIEEKKVANPEEKVETAEKIDYFG